MTALVERPCYENDGLLACVPNRILRISHGAVSSILGFVSRALHMFLVHKASPRSFRCEVNVSCIKRFLAISSALVGLMLRLVAAFACFVGGFGLFDRFTQLTVWRQLLVVLHPLGSVFDCFRFQWDLLGQPLSSRRALSAMSSNAPFG